MQHGLRCLQKFIRHFRIEIATQRPKQLSRACTHPPPPSGHAPYLKKAHSYARLWLKIVPSVRFRQAANCRCEDNSSS